MIDMDNPTNKKQPAATLEVAAKWHLK